MRALDQIAYVIGYASLTVTASTVAIALVILARDIVDRMLADRRARRDAIAGLVDLRTGEVLPAHDAPQEPALWRWRRQ